LALDDLDRELENYKKTADDDQRKTARINRVLFLVLIIMIIIFIYSLWRYQALN